MPASSVDMIFESSKRVEMQEGIFSSVISKDDVCFNDIAAVVLPKNLCPFGCKKKECPYDWDEKRCPHNLREMSTERLSDYVIKTFYYGDEGIEVSHEKQVDPKLLEAIKNYKRPGNYGTSRQDNN